MSELIRLTEIDASNIELHSRLNENDNCLFLFEYTSGQGYSFSATNDLISNLKKKPGAGGQQWKGRAIRQSAEYLRRALSEEWLKIATLVPIPPSKAADDPLYDDRMVRICNLIQPGLDIRQIIRQTQSTAAAHEVPTGERPSVEDLLAVYEIDESAAEPTPKIIGIFDDGGVRATGQLLADEHEPQIESAAAQPVPSFQFVARDNPPGGDDVCAFPIVAAER